MRVLQLAAVAAVLLMCATSAEAARRQAAPGSIVTQFCGDRPCPVYEDKSDRNPGFRVGNRGFRADRPNRSRIAAHALKRPGRHADTAKASPRDGARPWRGLPSFLAAFLPPAGGVCAPADLAAVASNEAFDDNLSRARSYLVLTSTPGLTMSLLGPEVAVAHLHPVFAIRAAAAIVEARASGLPGAGLYSAYRPARFGIGGFGDKLNSLHAYGLAGDFTGIGRAGSDDAATWYRIATKHGLYNPYGSRSRSEFNHYQATRVTIVLHGSALRATVTRTGPSDLARMWKVGATLLDAGPDRARPRHAKHRVAPVRIQYAGAAPHPMPW